jgi:hypothetical protein
MSHSCDARIATLTMNRPLATLIALAFGASMSFAAQAQDTTTPATAPAATSTTTTAPDAPVLNKKEAKDLKTESKATYKARKDVAEANKDLNKGDCEVAHDGSAERACKKAASAQAKTDKAEAKAIHEAEKDAIKANAK